MDFLPVGNLSSRKLCGIFSDLHSLNGPESTDLFLAITLAQSCKPLEAINRALQAFCIRPKVVGEKRSILRFKEEPLSYGLRITSGAINQGKPDQTGGGSDSDSSEDYSDGSNPQNHDDFSRATVYLHSDSSVHQLYVHDVETLSDTLECILSIWRTLEAPTGSLRRRKPECELLAILEEDKYFPAFAECKRAIQKDCLLDACVELLTPFGFSPRELDGQRVVFRHSTLHRVGITRLDKHTSSSSTPTLNRVEMTSIIVTGLQSTSANQIEEDRERSLSRVARQWHLSYSIRQSTLKKGGLVFSLGLPRDRETLVHRLLKQRNEVMQRCRDDDDQRKKVWLGKQPCKGWKSEEEMREVKRRVGKAMGRKSPLREVECGECDRSGREL